jgi:hypothetical protein
MELTFENWLSGEIELEGTYRNNIPNHNTPEFEKFELTKFSIDLFPKKELTKIKVAQKKYFVKLSKELYKKIYISFNHRYYFNNNALKVLETELFYLEQIIEGRWKEMSLNLYFNEYTNISMFKDSFSSFEHYITKIKERGFKPYYDFVPSPNSKYYKLENSIIPEIYANVLYDIKTKLSQMHPNPSEISFIPKAFFKEPKNKFPKIFSNGWAYRTFIILQEIITVNEKTYNADYALVYHCLRHPDIGAIIKNVDKSTFVNFINQLFNEEEIISVSLLRKSTSIDKNKAIHFGLKFYLNKIGFNGNVQKLLNKITN